MNKQRILFIGAGRMAEAIFSGLLSMSKEHIESITVSNRSDEARLDYLKSTYDLQVTTDWKSAVAHANVIVLAMPPQAHEPLLKELAALTAGQLVVTVAAGIGPSYLEAHLPTNTPAAWIMPNTAATIGESMSLYAVGQHVTDEHEEVLEMILKGMGEAQKCTEEEVHNLTAVTGSAPAFLYYFAESLIDVTKKFNIDDETAKQLVVQMLYGSVAMLKGGTEPSDLREQVTTPGGATAEGLKVLQNHDFATIIDEAIAATNKKARGN